MMDTYQTLEAYICSEVDIIEDDYEFSIREYEAIRDWYFDRGFSEADREFALGRGYDENLEYWEELKNEQRADDK